ncbi:hypothetical protein [Streptomyces sp. UNOB3_S3]|uniref:hypothetical protein n=1 Tax=Streptomyces sp. UNOB3_S3 TaxID=2871682 RepID=UPI001E4C0E3F|nr:hypothetical protein [Streptomyces sp. UNOB3_S3]MCC3775674.1 hypothetical protein [Streptomyces sp. UNOB3_S3]
MTANGTIDRPSTHDPKKQDPTMHPTSEPFAPGTTHERTGATASRQNRNHAMQLIPEALARAHMHDRLREAESQRMAVRLAAARRMQRRAERASLRARRALAMAVMQ